MFSTLLYAAMAVSKLYICVLEAHDADLDVISANRAWRGFLMLEAGHQLTIHPQADGLLNS